MNQTIKERWAAALRSGDYPQTRGALRRTAPSLSEDPVGYCCLGVLCELAVDAGVIQRADDRGLELLGQVGYLSRDRHGAIFAETALLPKEVVEWAGLDSVFGPGTVNKEPLTTLNDHGVPFDAIADIIEREA